MNRLRPSTLRGRVVLGAVGVVASGLAILVLAFNLLLAASLRGDVDSGLRSRAAAALTTVKVAEKTVRTSEGPGDAALDSGVWVFQQGRIVERPPASAELERSAVALAARAHGFATTPGGGFRLHAVPVTRSGRRLGSVVVASSLDAYERSTRIALIGSLLFAGAVLAVMAAVTWRAVGNALRPVTEMTRRAAGWNASADLDGRFATEDRPAELEQLAETFNGLLDRVAASLRHEQRLSAELSHELRTPLARIAAQAQILTRRPHAPDEQRDAAALITRSSQRMTAILDTLMAAARAEAGVATGACDVQEAARSATDALAGQARERGVEISIACPAPLRIGVDRDVVERILTPIVENAVRFATTTVNIAAQREGPAIRIDIVDDGPGIPASLLDAVFEPGVSSPPQGTEHLGAGLGLPLSRRLARAAGGEVSAIDAPQGGRLRVQLPAAWA